MNRSVQANEIKRRRATPLFIMICPMRRACSYRCRSLRSLQASFFSAESQARGCSFSSALLQKIITRQYKTGGNLCSQIANWLKAIAQPAIRPPGATKQRIGSLREVGNVSAVFYRRLLAHNDTKSLTCFVLTCNNHVQQTSLKLLPGFIFVFGKGHRDRFPCVRGKKKRTDACLFVKQTTFLCRTLMTRFLVGTKGHTRGLF